VASRPARLIARGRLSTALRSVRTLMLSMHGNEQYFFSALQAGANDCVLKSGADEDLVRACRAAMRAEPLLYAGAGQRPRA